MGLFQRIKKFFRRRYTWPAIDITLPGNRHLHLVGSIHMGTEGMYPLPVGLLRKLYNADALLVEADVATGGSPFLNLPECPPLAERLSAEQLTALDDTLSVLGLTREEFDTRPAWHIALVLQATQAQRLGLRPDFGIDYQLLKSAHELSTPIIELEGTESQVEILLKLADGGNELLQDTLTHWHENARLLQVMLSWWLESPPNEEPLTLPTTFSASLHDVLMHQRNQAWCERLLALPAGHYVVAAGALHLYGEGNLPALLRQKNGQ